MKKYAIVVDGIAQEVFTPLEGFTIEQSFREETVKLFEEVPSAVTAGSTRDTKGKWTIATPEPEPTPVVLYPVVTPATFRNLFTPAEERAIKKLVADEPDGDIAIWWSRLFDSTGLRDVDLNLASIQNALQGLVQLGAIESERVAEILTGEAK